MATQFHINGTCEVEYSHSQEVEEFYVDDVVKADSEVQAITAVARLLLAEQNFNNFVWTRLYVEAVPS